MLEVVSPESVGLSSARLEKVTSWLEAQISSERLAGASVLVGRYGQVAYFETAGLGDVEAATAFNKDSILRIYSMTKPITTVAAMMLYEDGCFQLDDPVAKYLPEFADTPVWAGEDADASTSVAPETAMTIRHIMTHTSGLTYGFMRTNVIDACYREVENEPGNLEEWVKQIAKIPLICQPGSQWNYSVSTDVLGRLVEVWSGQSLETFFQERIFIPLNMKDTGFQVSDENHERFISLYAPLSGAALGNIGSSSAPSGTTRSGGFKLQETAAGSTYLKAPSHFSGGGGLTSTMFDYQQFCQMLMNDGELNGVRLLGRKTVGHMRLNHLPDNKDMAAMGQPVWSETSYDGIGFGLGFAVVLDPVKANIITSAGEHHWGGAASTFFWLDVEEDLFVIFMTQLIPSSTYPIRRELRTRVYQAIID